MVKNIIFDFDGVLADSLDSVIELLNNYGSEYGLPRLSRSDVRNTGLTGLIQKSKISTFRLPFFVRKMRNGLSEMIGRIPIHGGMADTIRELRKNFNLGILTSNSSDNVSTFLKLHDLGQYFSYVFSSNSFFAKNESAQELLSGKGLKKTESVYVGDEVRDIVAMKKIGLPIVAVGWGYDGDHLLKPLKPEFFATTPSEFLSLAAGWRVNGAKLPW